MGGNMSQKSKSCSWAAEYVDWKKNVRLCGGRYIMSLELKGIWNNPPCRFLMQKRGIIRKNENGLRGMKGNYKAMTKQSSKVHFTVQTRTFLSDNVSGDSSVIHVSASLILKKLPTRFLLRKLWVEEVQARVHSTPSVKQHQNLFYGAKTDQHIKVNLENKKVVWMHSHLVLLQGLVFCPDTRGWSELQALRNMDVRNMNQGA